MSTFSTADILALASRAALRGDHALASLIGRFADRPGPGTDHIIRTVADELLTKRLHD